MKREHLITPEEVGKYSRPISMHMDQDVVMSFISEVEEISIIPAIGESVYKSLLSNPAKGSNRILLDGGWEDHSFDSTFDKTFATGTDEARTVGLKKAIAYYVYARLLRWNDIQVTRFGSVKKDGEYSEKPYGSEKSSQYGEAVDIADRCLANVVSYLERRRDRYPGSGCNNHTIVNTRTRFSVIGD